MRIAVLSPVWFAVPPSGYGGIEWVVSLLADGLVDAGHDVTIFASGDSRTKAQLDYVFEQAPSEQIGKSLPELRHALACFDRVLVLGFQDDHDLMLQIGRALFREGVLDQARRFFEGALRAHPDSADAAACVGYAAHRLADEGGSLHWLRRALELDPSLGEARIYLANLLYDRGEYEAALFHLERTGPEEHYDALAIWRLVELKKSVYRLPEDDPELVPWNERLNELAGDAEHLAHGVDDGLAVAQLTDDAHLHVVNDESAAIEIDGLGDRLRDVEAERVMHGLADTREPRSCIFRIAQRQRYIARGRGVAAGWRGSRCDSLARRHPSRTSRSAGIAAREAS